MPYIADSKTCEGCSACVDECPSGAIALKNSVAVIDPDLCLDCGACEATCPVAAISPLP
jgi:NAD-dependent dihydropyrimidine dehydrogenase PreA subunit